MSNNSNLSIVLPVKNCLDNLKLMLHKIDNQTILPTEIIIVDTSTNDFIKNFINIYRSDIKIKYI